MNLLLLAVAMLVFLVLIPLGLPGTWLIAGAALAYSILVPGTIGTITIIGVAVLAMVAELIEFVLSVRYTRKYGGSKRAAWGAVIGSIVGAVVGVPVPIIGSVIGAFAGAFVGALVAERLEGASGRDATRVATGALIGRAVAAAAKIGIACVMVVWTLAAAWH